MSSLDGKVAGDHSPVAGKDGNVPGATSHLQYPAQQQQHCRVGLDALKMRQLQQRHQARQM